MKDRRGFLSFCNDRARSDYVSFFYCDMCMPFFLSVKGIYTDTTGNIFAGGFCNLLQRTLDTVEDIVDDTRSEKNGDGITGTGNCFARAKSCGFFEYLNGGHAFFQTNDFTDQIFFSYVDHFGNLKSGIAFQVNDRAVDAINNTCFIHDSALRQI